MPASVASLWRHQNAGFLTDPGFMSLCCNHISCRVVHVTPRGSAAHLSSDTFIFPSLPPHGGLTPLPTTYAFLVFSFFYSDKSQKSVLPVSHSLWDLLQSSFPFIPSKSVMMRPSVPTSLPSPTGISPSSCCSACPQGDVNRHQKSLTGF